MSARPTVAFFGATGGCALNTLVLALKAGYKSVAFVRTPAKLSKMLTEAPHSLSQETLDANLVIVKGDIYDIATIKPVFSHNPDLLISGVGGAPKLAMNPIHPFTLDQPDICTTTAKNIVAALKELDAEKKLTTRPFFVAVGTTGMSQTRDIPIAMIPLYKVLLHTPHMDKGVMEKIIVETSKETSSVLSGFAIIRPSLLQDGPSKGLSSVKMGWEYHALAISEEKAPGAAIGYIVRRADIGLWMYENLIASSASNWNRRCVSLTY